MSTDLRKRKITYTIILTSDSPRADARRMHIKTGALAAVSFVLFVAVICYAVLPLPWQVPESGMKGSWSRSSG